MVKRLKRTWSRTHKLAGRSKSRKIPKSLRFKLRDFVAQQGWRHYFQEFRNLGFESSQNLYATRIFSFLGLANTAGSLTAGVANGVGFADMLNAVTVPNTTGESTLPQLGTIRQIATDGVSNNWSNYTPTDVSGFPNQYFFKKFTCTFNIRNTDHSPIDIEIRFCTVRESQNLSSAVFDDVIMDAIRDGAARDEVDGPALVPPVTLAIGDKQFPATAGGIMDHYAPLRPEKSRTFRQSFRIDQTQRVKLQPGDEIIGTYGFHNRIFAPAKEVANITEGTNNEMLRGKTKFLMVTWRGMLGRSDDLGEYNKVGYMKADIAVTQKFSASFVPIQLNNAGPIRYSRTDIVDLTGEQLAGYVPHVLVNENN